MTLRDEAAALPVKAASRRRRRSKTSRAEIGRTDGQVRLKDRQIAKIARSSQGAGRAGQEGQGTKWPSLRERGRRGQVRRAAARCSSGCDESEG
ncbi:MAG: hypothetical protein MZW92_37670 [Comamonadaceae bacterium]|nr:hypothetical protein [Comamonadaceae bacterium]